MADKGWYGKKRAKKHDSLAREAKVAPQRGTRGSGAALVLEGRAKTAPPVQRSAYRRTAPPVASAAHARAIANERKFKYEGSQHTLVVQVFSGTRFGDWKCECGNTWTSSFSYITIYSDHSWKCDYHQKCDACRTVVKSPWRHFRHQCQECRAVDNRQCPHIPSNLGHRQELCGRCCNASAPCTHARR